MSHWHYIAIAYGAFAAMLAWDYLMPRLALRQAIRRIRLLQRRKAAP